MKNTRYFFEALFARLFFFIFSILPLKTASNFGSFLARSFGPFFGASKTAKKQMQEVMPEAYNDDIIAKIWDNLGRNVAEFPHYKKMTKENYRDWLDEEGFEHLAKLKELDNGAIFVTAHFGNWEMLPKVLHFHGYNMTTLYRSANNKNVDAMIDNFRTYPGSNFVPIGKRGLGKFIKTVREKNYGGILIDQKFNKGSMIDFLGKPAPTGTFIAEIAKKYGTPIVYFHCERLDGHKMKVIIDEPIVYEDRLSVEEIMLEMHKKIESWIRKYPEQWFWVHRRWKK